MIKKCIYCKQYFNETTCGYTSSNCRIYGSLDCDQNERHPDTAAATCPDFEAYIPLEYLRRKHNPETFEWGDLAYAAAKYNIPTTARIQLATGWECSDTCADELFYNPQENILVISYGCGDWYDTPDWVLVGSLQDIIQNKSEKWYF